MDCSIRAQAKLGGNGMLAIEHDLLDQLTDRVLSSSQCKVAAELGVSTSYLNDVLRGRRCVSDHLAMRIGWQRVVVFVKR